MFFTSIFVQALLATAATATQFDLQPFPHPGVRKLRLSEQKVHGVKPVLNEFWAGAMHRNSPASWMSISATIVAPDITVPVGGGPTGLRALIGIDGDTCDSNYVQAGLAFFNDGNTSTYSAVFGIGPFDNNFLQFTRLKVTAGNSYTFKIQLGGPKNATVTVNDDTAQVSAMVNLTADAPFCQQDVEWSVNGFKNNDGSPMPLPTFGTFNFQHAISVNSKGLAANAVNGVVFDIEHNGVVLTDVTAASANVTVVQRA